MDIKISQRFSAKSLIRFSIPSIFMMVFMSLYSIVDGIFVSRIVGSNALSSINIVFPVINLIIAVGLMISTGGNAMVSKKMGEKDLEGANNVFTVITLFGIFLSLMITIFSLLFSEEISYFLGSNDELLADCIVYLRISAIFAPSAVLQILYQLFFVTAGKPRMGLILTVMSGLVNIVLDYIFIAILGWRISGAAYATGIGQLVPVVIGTAFFINKKNVIHFVLPKSDISFLPKVCHNGMSEMVSQLSTAVVTMMFNIILMRLIGSDGVAAITVILYSQFIFSSIVIGFGIGVAPVFGYFYGAKEPEELERLHKICKSFILSVSISMFLLAIIGKDLVLSSFFDKGSHVYDITKTGFLIFSLTYIFSGLNGYASALFTSLSDGKTSAIISLMHTFVFIAISLLVLPEIIGLYGVWMAVPIAEILTIFISKYYEKKKLFKEELWQDTKFTV